MARRTKIVATIGIASREAEVMKQMMQAGMDVVRIPLAHTPLDEALEIHKQVRAVAADTGKTVATMVDLPGPVVRTGFAPDGGVELTIGSSVKLVGGDEALTPELVSIDYPNLAHEIIVGDSIHIGESAVVTVSGITEEAVTATVTNSGVLRGRSAVEIPLRSLNPGALSSQDRHALQAFIDAEVDIVVVSARHGSELAELELAAPPDGPLLIAKIQSMEAIDNLDSLIEHANGILIDRGALGLQARIEELPHLQKQVIEECISGGLPVTTASQMLDSMIVAPVPTRAETTDVTNAIFDGTSSVMLAAETAIGAHPVEAVATMARIAERADDNFDHAEWTRRVQQIRMAGGQRDAEITDAMTIGAARTAESLGLASLVCISSSGFTVRSMARFRPKAQILGVSRHLSTVRQLAASWGVTPVLYDGNVSDYSDKVDEAIATCIDQGVIAPGELVGVVAGITSANRATDTFRIVQIPDA